MKKELLINTDKTRRRTAMGRGLRELLLAGELQAAAARAEALRKPPPVKLPEGIPEFARDFARKVWLRSGKPV